MMVLWHWVSFEFFSFVKNAGSMRHKKMGGVACKCEPCCFPDQKVLCVGRQYNYNVVMEATIRGSTRATNDVHGENITGTNHNNRERSHDPTQFPHERSTAAITNEQQGAAVGAREVNRNATGFGQSNLVSSVVFSETIG
jgi:hypothetical protein